MKNNVFRIVAGFASLYHGLLGLIGIFGSAPFIQTMIYSVYGINLNLTPELAVVIKFTSAYFLAFSVAMGLMAANPRKYVALIWVAVALFGTRIIYKIVYFEEIQAVFGGSAHLSEILTLVTITSILALLFWSRPRN